MECIAALLDLFCIWSQVAEKERREGRKEETWLKNSFSFCRYVSWILQHQLKAGDIWEFKISGAPVGDRYQGTFFKQALHNRPKVAKKAFPSYILITGEEKTFTVHVSLCFMLKMTHVFIGLQLQSGLFSPAKIMVDLLSFHLRQNCYKKRLKQKKGVRTLKRSAVVFFITRDRPINLLIS